MVASPSSFDSADLFGYGVSASAGFVAVGAIWAAGEDAETGGGSGGQTPRYDAGAVSIFMKSPDGTWSRVKTIHGTVANGNFGRGVAISPDRLIVAEPYADVGGGDNGGVRVFERDAGGPNNWGEVAFVTPPPLDRSMGGNLGAVAVSGNQLLMGAIGRRPDGTDWATTHYNGAAYLFTGGGSTWALAKEFVPPIRHNNQDFGSAVAMSQDEVVVGARGEDLIAGNAGAFYVFGRDIGGANNWGLAQHVTLSEADAFLGADVAISGDTIAVSAYREDKAGWNSGAVHIYYRDTVDPTQWNEHKILFPVAPNDIDHVDFGAKISLSGDTLVVGAPGDDTDAGNAGATFVYKRDEGGADNWGLVTRIAPASPAGGEAMGSSVAVTGDMVVAGAERVDNASVDSGVDDGAVFVYGCPSP